MALLPVLALLLAVVALVNRSGNRGSLFFTQAQMGRDCRPFTILKLRTMLPAAAVARGHDDPLKVDRITSFGAFLRRGRLDELPQIVNVLRGEMSFVGPRPDIYHHALRFLDSVPGYRVAVILGALFRGAGVSSRRVTWDRREAVPRRGDAAAAGFVSRRDTGRRGSGRPAVPRRR